jgi:DNA-binding transcriptional LysR family regulator
MLDVSLRELEYVAALEAARNFTRAAQQVHIAQPAFSQAIRRIERRLGITLFERTSRTVTPTAAGELLAAHARVILIDVTNAVAAARRIAGTIPVLSVHVSEPSLSTSRHVLSTLRAAFPEQEIRQTTLPHNQVRQGLVDGSLTLAVGEAIRAPGIQSILLTREAVGAILSVQHPLAAKKSIQLADFANYPIVSIDDTLSRWNLLVEKVFASAGIAPSWSRTTTFGAATGSDLVDDHRTILICVECMVVDQPAHRTWRPIEPCWSTDWYLSGRSDITTREEMETVTSQLAIRRAGP